MLSLQIAITSWLKGSSMVLSCCRHLILCKFYGYYIWRSCWINSWKSMKPLEQNTMPDTTDKDTVLDYLLVQCRTKENTSPKWNISRCYWNTKKPIYINSYSVNRLKCASCADFSVLVQLIINIYQCLFWPFQLFMHWRYHGLKCKPYSDSKRKIHSCNWISFKKSGSRMVYVCAVCFLLKVVDIRKEFEASCRNLASGFLMVSTRSEHANNWYQLEDDKVVEGIFSSSVLWLTALVSQKKT